MIASIVLEWEVTKERPKAKIHTANLYKFME